METGAYVDTYHSQQFRQSLQGSRQAEEGQRDVSAGAEEEGEGVGTGAHVDT